MVILPLIWLAMLLGLTVVVWQIERHEREQSKESKAAALRGQYARRIERIVDDWVRPLRRLRRDRLLGSLQTQAEFVRAAGTTQQELRSLPLILWVDAAGVCRFISPAPANEGSIGTFIAADPALGACFDGAARTLQPFAGPVQVIEDPSGPDPQLPVAVPVVAVDGDESNFHGAVVALISVRALSDELDQPRQRQSLSLTLMDDATRIMGPPVPDEHGAKLDRHDTVVKVLNRQWLLHAAPVAEEAADDRDAAWVLYGGILLSVLASLAAFQHLLHRWRDAAAVRADLAALESLNELSTSISGRLGGGKEVLDALANRARELLGMAMSNVAVLGPDGKTLQYVAISGIAAERHCREIAVEEAPASATALSTHRVLVIDDIDKTPDAVNARQLRLAGARAFLAIPLRIENRPIGVLSMADPSPRRFTTRDLRLAELLGSQASVLLANHRLYEQMHDALRTQQRLLDQRERLNGLLNAIYDASSVQEVLDKIVTLAPARLEVDGCTIHLVEDDPAFLKVAAASGRGAAQILGFRYEVAGTHVERVFRDGQLLVIPDAANDPLQHMVFRAVRQPGALALLPLFASDRKRLGLLVLVRRTPGTFDSDLLNLAILLSVRAAAALENTRLYEQLRRSAQTQATFLRELNHRVKNNLSAIVALLTIDEPELGPKARQWLDRAIARIRTMARTHELFTGELGRVSLDRLIGHVLASLAVAKPAEVEFRTTLEAPDITLSADHAVGLAMALHELCYNALVHGVGRSGAIDVVARQADEVLCLEVIDEGDGEAVVGGSEVHSRTGLGLTLVSGLVHRELGGRFAFGPRPDGRGSRAVIEIPASVLTETPANPLTKDASV